METEKKKASKPNAAKGKKVEISNFGDLEGKFLLVKVGNDKIPATTEQINDIETKLLELFEKNNVNCLAFVTHHYIDMEIIEKNKNN